LGKIWCIKVIVLRTYVRSSGLKAKSGPSELRTQYTIIFQRSKVIAFSALATSLIFIGHKALVEIYINMGVICGQNLDTSWPWKFRATDPNSGVGSVDVNFVLTDKDCNADKKSGLRAKGTTLMNDSPIISNSVVWLQFDTKYEYIPPKEGARESERTEDLKFAEIDLTLLKTGRRNAILCPNRDSVFFQKTWNFAYIFLL